MQLLSREPQTLRDFDQLRVFYCVIRYAGGTEVTTLTNNIPMVHVNEYLVLPRVLEYMTKVTIHSLQFSPYSIQWLVVFE
jgi:hypothetical protein